MTNSFLKSTTKQFEYYKGLGEKTFDQLTFEALNKEVAEGSNTIAIIVKHLVGNMVSRWTHFLTEDGEKAWRQRDLEFEKTYTSKEDLITDWNRGWQVLFSAVNELTEADLERIIYIRNQAHTVTEAIHRQLAHYAYHIGQIVFLGKLIKGKYWHSLSIPKGGSKQFNDEKFSR